MKKILRLISVAVAVCFVFGILFTGCGSTTATEKKEETVQAQAQSKAEESTKPAQPAESKKAPVKLKFTYWGSPVEKKAVEDAVKKFQEKYNWITVDAQHIPGDYATKITAMVAGNEAPDVAYLGEDLALPWAEEGKLYNIQDFLNTDKELKKDDFLDSIWYNWAPGKTLGTNTACEAFAIFYNKDLFKAANVAEPPTKAEEAWTWDQFVETAKKLTIDQNGKNAADPAFNPAKIKQYGVHFETWWGPWMSMVFSNGGDFVNADGTKLALTQPEAIEAIQKMADLINKYHVAPSPVAAKTMPAPAVALQSKQIAMTINGQWILLDLGSSKMNFGVGVLPKLKKSITLVLGAPTVIFKSTKTPEESWLLFKWLANPESSLDLQAGGLWMPLLKNWYTDPSLISKWAENNPAHPDGYKDAVMKQAMTNGVPGPGYYVKNFGKINAVIGPALDQVWLGKKTAEQALKEVEVKAQAEVKGRYDNTK